MRPAAPLRTPPTACPATHPRRDDPRRAPVHRMPQRIRHPTEGTSAPARGGRRRDGRGRGRHPVATTGAAFLSAPACHGQRRAHRRGTTSAATPLCSGHASGSGAAQRSGPPAGEAVPHAASRAAGGGGGGMARRARCAASGRAGARAFPFRLPPPPRRPSGDPWRSVQRPLAAPRPARSGAPARNGSARRTAVRGGGGVVGPSRGRGAVERGTEARRGAGGIQTAQPPPPPRYAAAGPARRHRTPSRRTRAGGPQWRAQGEGARRAAGEGTRYPARGGGAATPRLEPGGGGAPPRRRAAGARARPVSRACASPFLTVR